MGDVTRSKPASRRTRLSPSQGWQRWRAGAAGALGFVGDVLHAMDAGRRQHPVISAYRR